MPQQTKESLREEFREFGFEMSLSSAEEMDIVSEWFIFKLDHLITQDRERLIEKIQELEQDKHGVDYSFRSEKYNQALEDVLAIIKNGNV